MNTIHSNQERARLAVILLWIVLFWNIIAIVSSYLQYDLLKYAINTGELTDQAAVSNDLRESFVGISGLLILIISAITFIRWFWRAYSNLHLKINTLSYNHSWAAWGWFIPILNLYRPYKIMQELYNETFRIFSKHNIQIDEQIKKSTNLVGIWWTVWIVDNLVNQMVFRYTINANTLESLVNASLLDIGVNMIGIFSALLAIKVVKNYAFIENMLKEVQIPEEYGPAFNQPVSDT